MSTSDHLPECYCYREPAPGPQALCICKRLRQAEQRVTDRHNAEHEDDRLTAFGNGYAAGVQAAREAVAASGGHSDRCICDECYGTAAALAAIDALLDKAKDVT